MTIIAITLGLLCGSADAAAPLGPAFVVKQVSAPKQLMSGVETIEIGGFSGTDVDIAAQISAELADQERTKTDAKAFVKDAIGMAADAGSQYLGGLAGGGLQGKVVEGLTKNTVAAVSDGLQAKPLVLDSGLTISPFTVVASGGDATLSGSVRSSQKVEDFTQKRPKKDKDGKVVKDKDGKPVMIEVQCKRRSVEVTVDWQVTGAATVQDTLTRRGSDARCGENRSQLASAEAIATSILQTIGKPISRAIAPAWRVKRLGLGKGKAVKDGLKLVRKNDWEGARCAFATAAAANASDPTAVFNHGVALEAFGHHALAEQQYDAALALKDKKPYQKAKERVIARVVEVRGMTETYGLTWKVGEEPAACGG